MNEIFLACLGILLVLAALNDLRSYTIPNWLSVAIVALFLARSVAYPPTLLAFGLAIGATVLVFALSTFLFSKGLFGGGDVKLLTSLTLWVGFIDLPRLLLTMTLSGGVLALAIIAIRSYQSRWQRFADRRIPYGIAIAVAGLEYCLRQAHFAI